MNTPQAILAAVATLTGVPKKMLTGRETSREAYLARFLAIAAVRHFHPKETLAVTALHFGRDHSSIIHAMRRHRDLLEVEEDYAATWHQILTSLTPNDNQP